MLAMAGVLQVDMSLYVYLPSQPQTEYVAEDVLID